MKKIVALVLSLVMVLGLATTAFGATTYEGLTAKTSAGSAHGAAGNVTLTVVDAVAPVYNDDDELTTWGKVAYATESVAPANTYVLVDSLSDVTNGVVMYTDAACKYPAFYLQMTSALEYAEGSVFTNFGKACGEVKWANYDATKTYYTVKGEVAANIYVADAVAGTKLVKVGAEYVKVSDTGVDATDVVAHTPVISNKDGKTVAVECSKCGLDALQVANALALPKNTPAIAGTLNTIWYWPAAAATPVVDADKVESAETFDAGIAMYVGMSVMAAAGSAVVLKKKD